MKVVCERAVHGLSKDRRDGCRKLDGIKRSGTEDMIGKPQVKNGAKLGVVARHNGSDLWYLASMVFCLPCASWSLPRGLVDGPNFSCRDADKILV
jgi:hypothetical protein